MAKCLFETENPQYVWAYEKGVKIQKKDGTFWFVVLKKDDDILTSVNSEELTQLVLNGQIS